MNRKNKTIAVIAEDETTGTEYHSFQNSSNVIAGDYNPKTKIMHISFKSGQYEYKDIPDKVWVDLLMAESAGVYINSVIVGPDRKNPIYKGVRIGD